MKRKFCLFLVIFSLIQLTACGDSADDDVTTTSVDTSASESETGYIPATIDYDGYTFRLYCVDYNEDYYLMDEETGDIVDDAVFDRNRTVEEQFNIDIEVTSGAGSWEGRTQFMDFVRGTIMAGEDAYDAVAPTYYYGMEMTIEGLFLNILDIPSIQLDEPWWCAGYNDNAVLLDKLYGACGYYSIGACSNMYMLFFNKTIQEEYNLPSFYDMVRDGSWTHDAFNSVIKDIYVDLNNDGAQDDGDKYGFIFQSHGARAFAPSYGVKYIERQPDGSLEITIDDEFTFDVYDKIYNMLMKQEYSHYFSDDNVLLQAFMDGNGLFMANKLSNSINMRSMDDDFGMIPLPKYDEKQENYISYMMGDDIYCLPVTISDHERTGTILDALNFYSYRDVVPVYCESALKSKYARDEDTAEMIELVMESSYYDIGFIYGSLINYIADEFGNNIVLNKNENFASAIASKMSGFETKLDELLEAYFD